MRVQDSKPIGVATMGSRKKQRPRKTERQNSETSEEGAVGGSQCSHLKKSVDLNQVRKSIKPTTVIGHCQSCHANNDSVKKLPKSDSTSLGASDSSSLSVAEDSSDVEPSVYFCLKCGHQGCDRYSPDKHALQHLQKMTSQSTAHNIALNLTSYQVWCYACDNFVPVDATKKLQECADYIYHNAGHRGSVASFVNGNELIKENGVSHDSSQPECHDGAVALVKDDMNLPKMALLNQAASGVLLAFPKVKGLNNLGNTCFFNAVVQNLGQTHLLESQLREFSRKGLSLDLCACPLESDSRPCTDDEMEEKEMADDGGEQEKLIQATYENLSLSLGDCGALTQSVLNLFDEMKTTNKHNSVNPSALFGQVCKKAPRFKGFQQQDSHELLRYLLDAIRGEETKRYQAAILKAFKLPDNPKPKEVSEELRPKLKAYGRTAKHTFVDSIFGGHFISTVVCQACDTPHQIFESFLDLSLPVVEEKSFKSGGSHGFKPKVDGKAVVENGNLVEDAGTPSGAVRQSKHMTKKERRMAKKKAAKGKKTTAEQDKQLPVGKDPLKLARGTDAMETATTEEAAVGAAAGGAEKRDEEEANDKDDHEDDQVEDRKMEVLKSGDENEEEAVGRRETSAVSNGELNNSSVESQSSDADIEDNEESDASRYHGMVNSTDALPEQDIKAEDGKPLFATAEKSNVLVGESENAKDATDHQMDKESDRHSRAVVENMNDITNAVDAFHLAGNSAENEHPAVREALNIRLENGVSWSEMCKNARRMAMKTLVPREKPVSQECSILSSLYQFTSHELLSGNNMYRCLVCNKHEKNVKTGQGQKKPVLTCASMQFLIFAPPAVLTLHLKRFQQVGFNLRKITRHIEFSELLDLAPFCSALCQNIRVGQRRIVYSLYGVVEHSGTLRSGHYTAYVKVRHSNPSAKQFLQTMTTGQLSVNRLVGMMKAVAEAKEVAEPETVSEADNNTKPVTPPPGKWYYISDTSVSEVRNISNVLSCQAYLIFYERIE